MPNYSWKCADCDFEFEKVVSLADIDRTVCVTCLGCGGDATRLPSAPSFKVTGGTPKFHGGNRGGGKIKTIKGRI